MKNILCVGIALLVPVLLFAQSDTWSVTESASSMENPREADSASLESGKASFGQFCQTCHGEGGAGDGTMVPMLRIENMPDFTMSDAFDGDTDGDIFFRVSNKGENKMPAFASRMSDEQRWDVVNFLRTLSD